MASLLQVTSLERAFYPGSQKVKYVSLEKEEEAVRSTWILHRGRKKKPEIRDREM